MLDDEVLPLFGGYAYTAWSQTEVNALQKPTGEYIFADYHNDLSITKEFNPPYPKTKYPFACYEMGGGMQTWEEADLFFRNTLGNAWHKLKSFKLWGSYCIV